MSAVKWHDDMIAAFDTETSGINPAEARIVTAAIVYLTPGKRPRPVKYLIDPGTPVPDEAAAVHGWTTDRITAAVGRPGFALRTLVDSTGKTATARIPRDVAIFEITGHLAATIGRGQALVVHNAAYDLTLLEHEAGRHQVDPLTSRPHGITGVIDPMVIEKAYDVYRKVCYRAPGCDRDAGHHECGGCRGGKHKCGGCGATDKKLESLCQHYGVRHAGAHDAADDAIAAARLGRRLIDAWPQIAAWKLSTLHDNQVKWRAQQSDSLREFWRKAGDERWQEVDSGWPLHSDVTTTATKAVA